MIKQRKRGEEGDYTALCTTATAAAGSHVLTIPFAGRDVRPFGDEVLRPASTVRGVREGLEKDLLPRDPCNMNP